jgi:hypothetical protein
MESNLFDGHKLAWRADRDGRVHQRGRVTTATLIAIPRNSDIDRRKQGAKKVFAAETTGTATPSSAILSPLPHHVVLLRLGAIQIGPDIG